MLAPPRNTILLLIYRKKKTYFHFYVKYGRWFLTVLYENVTYCIVWLYEKTQHNSFKVFLWSLFIWKVKSNAGRIAFFFPFGFFFFFFSEGELLSSRFHESFAGETHTLRM